MIKWQNSSAVKTSIGSKEGNRTTTTWLDCIRYKTIHHLYSRVLLIHPSFLVSSWRLFAKACRSLIWVHSLCKIACCSVFAGLILLPCMKPWPACQNWLSIYQLANKIMQDFIQPQKHCLTVRPNKIEIYCLRAAPPDVTINRHVLRFPPNPLF